MNFFKNFDWSIKSFAKVIWIIVWAIVLFTIIISFISLSVNTISNNWFWWNNNVRMEKAMYGWSSPSSISLNSRDVEESYWDSSSLSEEDFEIKEYSTNIKTSKITQVCKRFSDLKDKSYIIFEISNESETNCNYRFKVEKNKEKEILSIIEGLKPEYLNQNIQTIKRRIDNFETEISILTENLKSIEDTLLNAQSAYDELTILATKKEDTESLAKIIDSKLNLINTLTKEKLTIWSKITRHNKDKNMQLDRLKYSFFNININEDLIINWKNIKQSWKNEMKAFINNLNNMAENLTINLFEYILQFLLITVYFFISLFLLKIIWFITKKIWNR